MIKESGSRFRTLFQFLFSVSILAAGICLMAACLTIYHSGDQPFSREAVATAFAAIDIPVYLCIAMAAAGLILEVIFPRPAQKTRPSRQTGLILRRYQEQTVLTLCQESLRTAVLSHRRERKVRNQIGLAVTILCGAIFLSYGMNPHNFHRSQINESMIHAMYWFVPCCLIPFVYGIYLHSYTRKSMEAELRLLKSAPKESRIPLPSPTVSKDGHGWVLLRNAIFVLGIVILLYGYVSGGTADVLTKAVNICTECVGLG